MAKDYDAREQIKGYDTTVAKERLMRNASKLEELGFKRDANTLWRIVSELEAWQHK